jgi:hypothetical protein
LSTVPKEIPFSVFVEQLANLVDTLSYGDYIWMANVRRSLSVAKQRYDAINMGAVVERNRGKAQVAKGKVDGGTGAS